MAHRPTIRVIHPELPATSVAALARSTDFKSWHPTGASRSDAPSGSLAPPQAPTRTGAPHRPTHRHSLPLLFPATVSFPPLSHLTMERTSR
jgi:hypothetical protein